MTGPNEAKLKKVAQNLNPSAIQDAHRSWYQGAEGLRDVAESLADAKAKLKAAWEGSPSDAASTAFDLLAQTVSQRATQMDDAARALVVAKTALEAARDTDLGPDVPSMPSAPKPGDDGKVSAADKKQHQQDIEDREAAANARETAAATALAALDTDLARASSLLSNAAPYDPTSRTDDKEFTGPTKVPRRGVSGGVSSSSATGSNAVIGGTVGGSDATADGELVGTVGGGAGLGAGLIAGGKGGGSSTSTGSQIGGSVGGVAGAVGGVGGMLGGLRNVLGGKSVVAGGLTPRGTAVGGAPTRAGGPVIGGQSGQTGAAGRTAGGARGASSRVAGAPGTSSTGRAAGGGRGAAGATGGSAGGRGAGAGGRGGRGVGAGAAGQRDGNEKTVLDHLRFEDDWIDDEGVAPGVIE